MYNEVILFPESNSAEAFGLPISGSSPTEVYVIVVSYILERYPELVGQKETHFTDDPDRAAQYTGSTRDMVVEGRTVYIKTGFSTKDKWKNLERICQLAGISFSIGDGGTVKPTPTAQTDAPKVQKPSPAKSTDSKKAATDIDYAALAAKYAAQPVHDDFYQYNHIFAEYTEQGYRVEKANDWLIHPNPFDSNLIAYKGWYYYIKPLEDRGKPIWGLFRRLATEKQKETLVIELSGDDVEESSFGYFVPYHKVFGIHKDIIYIRKDSAIHCMNLDGSNMRKLTIHKDKYKERWRTYSPYPIDGGLAHMDKDRNTLYFYDIKTGTDTEIADVMHVFGTCGGKVFFQKKGARGLLAFFDSKSQTVININNWIPSLKDKNIILFDCRHEIIYYIENAGKKFVPEHKTCIYGVNFNGELVDVWKTPKLPNFEFDDFSRFVFNGEVYALKTVTPRLKPNNSNIDEMIQDHCVYTFTRSGEVKMIYQHEEGGLISQATPVNVAGNSIMLYLGKKPWSMESSHWSLIPTDSNARPAENYTILYDRSPVK